MLFASFAFALLRGRFANLILDDVDYTTGGKRQMFRFLGGHSEKVFSYIYDDSLTNFKRISLCNNELPNLQCAGKPAQRYRCSWRCVRAWARQSIQRKDVHGILNKSAEWPPERSSAGLCLPIPVASGTRFRSAVLNLPQLWHINDPRT